ncbi:MAG: hypothetical protein ACPGVD_00495 [Flavobacteriales bacterium]
MHKFNKRLEKFWLYFTFVVAAFCIYEFIVDDVKTASYYLVFLAFPIVMYLVRRGIRMRMEKTDNESKQKKSK